MAFVHLDCYSDYSLGESVIGIKELIASSANQAMPAVALADNNALFGAVQFYTSARQQGVKPIVGMSARLAWGRDSQRLILLCADQQGYANLKRLATRIHLEQREDEYSPPLMSWQLLENHHQGLLVLVDGVGSLLAQLLLRGKLSETSQLIDKLVRLFDQRIYFTVQRTGHPDEQPYLEAIVEMARLKGLALVATNPARFVRQDERELAEIRYAIEYSFKSDQVRQKQVFYPGQYLRSDEDMDKLFADLPQLLENSVEIARRCNLVIATSKALLPRFDQQDAHSQQQHLRQLVMQGLDRQAGKSSEKALRQQQDYLARINTELDIINSMEFTSYFLIVHEFIQWAMDNGISVGPGRGSVAGSLVAYCLGITDLDPLVYDLVFERFLNPERLSMPDIDIDFCIHNRDRVFQHVVQRYGTDSVAQIITFGRLRPRMAVRDVARALGYPHAVGDRVARLVPEKPDMTFERAFDESPELHQRYANDQEAARIIDLARRLEGKARNIGKHAAGVVIAPGEISDYAPLYRVSGQDGVITQYYKDDLDQIGLVKFDFLGLDTLTVIDQTLVHIQQLYNTPIDMAELSFEDPDTYKLLQKGDTIGVFQIESAGMRKHLRGLKPTRFEDLIAMLALYRPGPMQFIEDFIARKHGQQAIEYPHPSLEEILAPTYGIAVYQEQVMRIAQRLAGYSLAEADNLRRAMGKKKVEIMEQERHSFIERAQAKGVTQQDAAAVFGFIEKFAQYGFNKSHSAAYAVLSFRTAWLKAHYPLALYAATMTSATSNSTKLNILYKDCRKHDVQILPPHINHSGGDFLVNQQSQLVFGLNSIKGVSAKLTDALVKERELAEYGGLFDLAQRTDRSLLNKTSLEAMVCAGAIDGLGMTRAELFANIDQALKLADQLRTNHTQGTGDLFGDFNNRQLANIPQRQASVWSTEETLERERKVLGFYLTSHPYDSYRKEFAGLVSHSLEQAAKLTGRPQVRLAGVVIDLRPRLTRKGWKKLFSLEDGVNLIEARVSESNPQAYAALDDSKGKILLFYGKLHHDNFADEMMLEVESCQDYLTAKCALATRAKICLARNARSDAIALLKEFLTSNLDPQGASVVVELYKEGVITQVALGPHWRLALSPALINRFDEQCAFASLELEYNQMAG